MKQAAGQYRRWVLISFALLLAAVAGGFLSKYAIIYYAERRWLSWNYNVNADGLNEVCDNVESLLKQVAQAALKYERATGTIPTSQTALVHSGYLQRADIYEDPFSPRARGAYYKFRVQGRTLYIWSYGPDKKNDSAAVSYDPTNGLRSGGDIITVVKF